MDVVMVCDYLWYQISRLFWNTKELIHNKILTVVMGATIGILICGCYNIVNIEITGFESLIWITKY